MSSKSNNNRKSPTIPIQGFMCAMVWWTKSILESNIQRGEYMVK